MHLSRLGMLALAVPLLAGCADGDWDYLTRYDSPAATMEPAPAAAVNYRHEISAEDPSARACRRTAEDRAVDAERQGFDGDVSKAVYDKTYADCMAWQGRG
jgi:hypothetical protein